jgi:hypothetical protein
MSRTSSKHKRAKPGSRTGGRFFHIEVHPSAQFCTACTTGLSKTIAMGKWFSFKGANHDQSSYHYDPRSAAGRCSMFHRLFPRKTGFMWRRWPRRFAALTVKELSASSGALLCEVICL